YILCMWKKRLWPAKVLCKAGVAGETSDSHAKETSFEVEILGLKEQIGVGSADVVPLKEECIENIASNLDQRNYFGEAVEELEYRRSLKIALDILTQNGSARQVPPLEGPNTLLSQENNVGSLSSTPLRRYQSIFKEELEPETSKKKEQKHNPSLKSDTKNQAQKSSLILEGSGTNASKPAPGDSDSSATSDGHNCKTPGSKSLPRQEKNKPRLLTKSSPGNKGSPKPKEGRQRPRGAGSTALSGEDSPTDQAQPLAEEGSPLSAPCTADAVVPVRRVSARSQLRRTLLNSSCKSASEDLEKSISNESKSLAQQLDGRKKPESLKRVNGEEKSGGTVSSSRKRKCRNCPEPSSGPSDRLELSDLSSEVVPSENLSCLSALLDEEEEDEELPSILSPQEPQAIEEGILVWCKLRRYPYWPAVVKYVRRKHRKACVLLIDGTTSEKKKGFSVSLKNLKHFDCEEKQDLIERAKEDYRQEIEWCIQLISDYRIRVGCRSFTGSFLEYFAADISYPVRKEGYQGSVQMTFPNEAEENIEESPSETSPQKPPKKLLPDRSRAARDRANKKIVEFIVKTKGAEEHLLAILKSRKQSRWLKEFLNSSQYMTCVETYLEDEEQLDLVVNYLKEVYHGIDAKNLHQIGGDGIKLISDVLLPEAIIYAIAAVDDIDYKKAEEKYIKGPSVSKRERELFEEEILERKRQSKLRPPDDI
ncbi:MUM1 protein, partial [Eurystomus gularis]|nr:MUM1 protein [Eurystomus gularis]